MTEAIAPQRADASPRMILMRRVYKFLRDNPGPQQRDRIMARTGFEDPFKEPLAAYVTFQNTVMRVNAHLASEGASQRIAGGLKHNEHYWLESAS